MKKFLFNFFVLILISNYIFSTNYPGPGTDVPVEVYITPLQLRSGDRLGYSSPEEVPVSVLGLVWCAGGLNLINSGSSYAVFASPLPVNSVIGLAGLDSADTFLVLIEDFHLAHNITLTLSGRIEAKFGKVILNGTFDLTDKELYFVGASHRPRIDGKGNIINFSDGGKISVESDTLNLNNIYLKGLRNESISFDNPASSTMTFTGGTIQLNGNVCADYNVLVAAGELLITSTGRTFCFNRRLEISNGARLKMDYGTTFSLGYEGYIVTHGTGAIHFNGCNIEIGDNVGTGANGFYVENGLVLFENEVTIYDNANHKHFIIGSESNAKILSMARIVLDETSTFSVL